MNKENLRQLDKDTLIDLIVTHHSDLKKTANSHIGSEICCGDIWSNQYDQYGAACETFANRLNAMMVYLVNKNSHISGEESYKNDCLYWLKQLKEMGVTIYSTHGGISGDSTDVVNISPSDSDPLTTIKAEYNKRQKNFKNTAFQKAWKEFSNPNNK